MKRVFYPDLDMTKQLNEYRVEYQVLQEEMISMKPQMENLEKYKLMNKQLTQEVAQLSEQLEVNKKNAVTFLKNDSKLTSFYTSFIAFSENVL